jgi:hypothetical protein
MRVVFLIALLALAATATAATGTIQITVHPGGGTICLGTECHENPALADGTGSIVFENVEAGRYHMVNVYGTPGYKAYLGQVYLDLSGTSLMRDIVLDPQPSSPRETGSVKVYITPDGGKACLDKMCELSAGDRTGSWSVEFTDVTANTNHTLTLANEGYETYTKEIRLVSGEIISLTLTLNQIPPGNTTVPTPTPVPTTTPEPEPTTADLPWPVSLIAVGICGAVLVLKGRV